MNIIVEHIKDLKKYNISCNWAFLYVARQLKLCNVRVIEEYAVVYFQENLACTDSNVAELAIGILSVQEFDEILAETLKSLAYPIIEKDGPLWNKEKRKLRYCLIKHIEPLFFEEEPFQFLDALKVIYTDFGYPIDMWDFFYNPDIVCDPIQPRLNIFIEKEKKAIENNDTSWVESLYYSPVKEIC